MVSKMTDLVAYYRETPKNFDKMLPTDIHEVWGNVMNELKALEKRLTLLCPKDACFEILFGQLIEDLDSVFAYGKVTKIVDPSVILQMIKEKKDETRTE